MNERKFLDDIQDLVYSIMDVTSKQALLLLTSQKLIPIAEQLQIGRVFFHYIAPPSGYAPEGDEVHQELFLSDKGYRQDAVREFDYCTKEGGQVRFEVYPIRENWDTQTETDIEYLFSLLFLIYGRGRMSELLDFYMVTDQLTYVNNSVGLAQQVGRLVATGVSYQYTGLFINMKNFRYVNQVAGTNGADGFLKEFTRRVEQQLEDTETIARLGGDNFIVLLKDINTGRFLNFIENLEIGLKVNGEEKNIKVNTRIGIYSLKSGDTMAELMTNTNAALQIAKQAGQGDWVRFHPSMIKKINHDKDVVQSFPKALLAREFQVYYQPKIDMHTGMMVGSEALARWIRDGKMIPPMEFVPSLEEDGSICQLDFYILEQVCRALRRWIDAGMDPVPVSVNFSRMHFHNRNVGYDILDVLERFEIDPKYIQVEMTEMYGYENYNSMLKFISLMTESGIKVSVDDFGTGYSSLSLISNLHADTIKIDKSFLDKMLQGGQRDYLLVKNIVGMIKDMELNSVAEGVETKEQMEFLKEVGCSVGQGYLFDKPLPVEEYESRQKNADYYKAILK